MFKRAYTDILRLKSSSHEFVPDILPNCGPAGKGRFSIACLKPTPKIDEALEEGNSYAGG